MKLKCNFTSILVCCGLLICTCSHTTCIYFIFVLCFTDEPPEVISHPESLTEISPGKTSSFTVHVTGTEPMSYQWEWKPAVDGDGSEEWQPCNAERFSGTETSTLIISSVQKLNEGSYRSVISNYAGSKTSQPAKLGVGKNANTYTMFVIMHHHTHFCCLLYSQSS